MTLYGHVYAVGSGFFLPLALSSDGKVKGFPVYSIDPASPAVEENLEWGFQLLKGTPVVEVNEELLTLDALITSRLSDALLSDLGHKMFVFKSWSE